MGHPRRYYTYGDTYLVTNRQAEGLPFVPNLYIKALMQGALARAASRSPGVIICAYEFLQNHYHMVVLLKSDAEEMARFLHDVDDELAKVVKKLLGKRNAKIWAQRPHVAKLGNAQAVVERLAYCFLNAVEANFCDKASLWIGLNSFSSLFSKTAHKHKWVRTRKIRALPNKSFTKNSIRKLYGQWEASPGPEFTLQVDAYAWKHYFPETRNLSDSTLCALVLSRIEKGEKLCRQKRIRAKEAIADAQELASQNPYKQYKPTEFGKRVYCICTDPELRRELIENYQSFCKTCTAVWEAWKKGDLCAKLPPGAFLPPRAPLANVVRYLL